jgi:hypothetical protein
VKEITDTDDAEKCTLNSKIYDKDMKLLFLVKKRKACLKISDNRIIRQKGSVERTYPEVRFLKVYDEVVINNSRLSLLNKRLFRDKSKNIF